MSFPPRHRVRLWFGQHPIADYIGTPTAAARHEAAMRRRFPDLKITNNPLPATASPSHERARQRATAWP